MVRFPLFLLMFVLWFSHTGCEKDTALLQEGGNTGYEYSSPPVLADGLQVSGLKEEGIPIVAVQVMMDSIRSGSYGGFHSLLIFRHDRLVFEEYFDGWGRTDLHPLWSVTKSVTAAAVGIAIEQGYLEGTNQPVFELLEQFGQVDWTEAHQQITLEHYLTMTSGQEWQDTDSGLAPDDPENDYYQMLQSGDWLKYVLERPLVAAPGTAFNYNNGTSTVFSVILADATEQNADAYIGEQIFDKLGIKDYDWSYMPGGYAGTAGNDGGLFMRSRDLGKFGLLMLNEGQYNGEQLITADWVERCLAPQTVIIENENVHFTYGYQFWRNERVMLPDGSSLAVPYAVGRGGQFVFFFPHFDLLVVATSPFPNGGRSSRTVLNMLSEHLLAHI